MRTSLMLLLASALSFAVLACGEDFATNVLSTTENPNIYQPMPSYPGSDGIVGTVQFMYSPTGLPENYPIELKAGFARFGDFSLPVPIPGLDSLFDAGTVSINDFVLRKFQHDSTLMYSSFSTRHPQTLSSVNFDSTHHTFKVSGTTFFPGFVAGIHSPRPFSVSAPVKNGTAIRDSGLYVEWGGAPDSVNSKNRIMLRLSSSDTTYVLSREGMKDRGFYRFSRNDLAPFRNTVTLDVVKYRDSTFNVGGRTYTALSQIVHTVKDVQLF